ncbi:hypothetical protein NMY22_g17811 [Coprinellus aureogranulatus]|nr:hypothetical protein NMY22_g17811 [Coprinellus aureogranulatus]
MPSSRRYRARGASALVSPEPPPLSPSRGKFELGPLQNAKPLRNSLNDEEEACIKLKKASSRLDLNLALLKEAASAHDSLCVSNRPSNRKEGPQIARYGSRRGHWAISPTYGL